MRAGKIYHVKYEDCTDWEPQAGWYYTYEHPYDGAPMIIYCGEYESALDMFWENDEEVERNG